MSRAVEKCLKRMGTPYEARTDEFRLEVQSQSGSKWRTQLLLDEQNCVFRLFVFLTDRGYLKSRQMWVAQLACRVDEGISVLGGVSFDWDTGSAFLKYGVDFRSDVLVHSDDIEAALNTAAFPLQVWEKAFRHVHNRAISPLAALNAALIEVDAYPSKHVSNDTRRALLALVKNPT